MMNEMLNERLHRVTEASGTGASQDVTSQLRLKLVHQILVNSTCRVN